MPTTFYNIISPTVLYILLSKVTINILENKCCITVVWTSCFGVLPRQEYQRTDKELEKENTPKL
jgi:hypothetical protein